ncbi:hypothetical protein Mapa_016450 [Marchantia paleacea]|nr:hypothetical protein Mapa_016450 [Marchantia paleacea]
MKELQEEAFYILGTTSASAAAAPSSAEARGSSSASAASSTSSQPAIAGNPKLTLPPADIEAIKKEVVAIKRKIRKKMVEGLEEAGNGVWYVDNVVPKELKSLVASRLDAIADSSKKDFHPGSNDQVQDLIHPSMFPYVENVSPVNDPTILPQKSEVSFFRRQYEDSAYQWLPSEFAVDAQGSVKIQTYINNLEEGPNGDLYRAIELMFELFLPMFENVVSSNVDDMMLRSRNLQVIVKAANYLIQPTSQVYEGSWHVEGMSHEHIYATGIYYYSTSPFLKDGGLEFRRPRDQESDYPAIMDYSWDMQEELGDDFPQLDGLQENINLGAVPTVEDRLLVFPNGLQHKVSSIVNTSKDQVGTRKIFVFFLVDPNKEIVSTKHVPEQQWERIMPKQLELMSLVANRLTGKRIPPAIINEIVSRAKRGMTMEEARRHRLELMKERKYKVDHDNQEWEREYTLCEH